MMGFSKNRSEKAILFQKAKTIDPAIDWLMQHEEDEDIDV